MVALEGFCRCLCAGDNSGERGVDFGYMSMKLLARSSSSADGNQTIQMALERCSFPYKDFLSLAPQKTDWIVCACSPINKVFSIVSNRDGVEKGYRRRCRPRSLPDGGRRK